MSFYVDSDTTFKEVYSMSFYVDSDTAFKEVYSLSFYVLKYNRMASGSR